MCAQVQTCRRLSASVAPLPPPLQVHGRAKTFAHRSLFEFHQFAQALKMQVT